MLTSQDLESFTAHVRETMFSGAKTHVWPPEQAHLWPMITPEYRFQHTLHVRRFVEVLQAEDGGDLTVLQTAAIFHDISHFHTSYDDHGRVSAEMAKDYLTNHPSSEGTLFRAAFIDRVFTTVDDHASDKPDAYFLNEAPLESMILIEADLLDKVGPTGVISHLMLQGANRRFWREAIDDLQRRVIDRGRRALGNDGRKFRMTPAGRRLIEERLAWTEQFLAAAQSDTLSVF